MPLNVALLIDKRYLAEAFAELKRPRPSNTPASPSTLPILRRRSKSVPPVNPATGSSATCEHSGPAGESAD